MKQFNKQAGFTLIELIMVIVILGVLSAFALPRFADLGGNARTASITGLAGSIKAAANIAHAQALVDAGAHDDDVTLEGQAITMTQFYPTPDAAGIGQASQVSASATGAGTDYIGVEAATTVTYSLQTDCQVVYTAATTSTPTITTTVTGC